MYRVFPELAYAVRRRLVEGRCQDERQRWDQRIQDVLACPDNKRLHRVAGAGEIRDGFQMMHNGIEVLADGYYGEGITRMLAANGGCHEPQEEAVFDKILASLPPGAVMIEAGAYWAYYSLWFCQGIPGGRAYLIEPDAANLQTGVRNFERNGRRGTFTHAYIGPSPDRTADGVEITSLDAFATAHGLGHIHVVHADVQSAEAVMLTGAEQLLKQHAVDYWFISTHSMRLHRECRSQLERHGYRILASVDLPQSYSLDGLLVACSRAITPPVFAAPSLKPW